MPLTPGTRLGPYEITAPLGAGGMGEVYKARDMRLDRTVAIKVLPETLSPDPAFRERFEREAKSLSALNHPHICTVHDVGRLRAEGASASQGEAVDFLVMEYLEGRTLAETLERGPLGLEAALDIAKQIVDALDQAHRRGIVHRDLKPANVMLVRASSGATIAKVLDFGLAKQASTSSAAVTSVREPENVTRTSPLTASGTILGTFQYMAPEQLEGAEADGRTDIWAFGCVLYEMLSGRRAFDAPTQASLIAAILDRRPAPIDLAHTPLAPGLNRLVAACLEKNRDDRFQTMRDVRRELEWLPLGVGSSEAAPARHRGIAPWFAAILALLMVMATSVVTRWLVTSPGTSAPVMFHVTLQSLGEGGDDAVMSGAMGPAVSPDGSRIAFVVPSRTDTTIWIRDVSRIESRQLKGTSGVRSMFWSPSGDALAFFAGGRLKVIDVASEKIDNICDAPAGFGGTWGADGTILFSPDERSPIFKVSARGGTPAAVTSLDTSQHEQAHRWPQFLPDGRHFLYMPWTDSATERAIHIGSLDGAPPRKLLEAQSAAVFAGDYVLYAVDKPARLMAWAFDPRTMQLQGTAFTAVPDNNVDYHWMTGNLSASAAGGTLAYTTGKYDTTQLTWLSRTGRPLGSVGDPGEYFDPWLSDDGAYLALEKHDRSRGSGDIWTVDMARNAFSRLTSAPGFETTAIWSPDGRRVVYASDQGATPQIYVKSAAGTGPDEVFIPTVARAFPTDWSRDGRQVLFMLNGGATGIDIWSYDVERRTASPLLASTFNEGWATFSPDGKWFAYESDEGQQHQVYVRSFPDGAVKVQVSPAGGAQPQWRRDGRELFYLAPDNTVMAAEIHATATAFAVSVPQGLFTAKIDQAKSIRNQYAVSADGQRFLILSIVQRAPSPIVAVLNWRSLIQRK